MVNSNADYRYEDGRLRYDRNTSIWRYEDGAEENRCEHCSNRVESSPAFENADRFRKTNDK